MRAVILSLGLALGLIASPLAAAAPDEEPGSRVVIGDRFPLAQACYEKARDGATGSEGLAPCDQSLESEQLTKHRRAIVYANRGVVQYNSGDYAAAINDFTSSLDLDVFAASQVHANRGLAYEVLRFEALARADYQKALAINSDNQLAKRRLAELAKPYFERSQIPRRITAEAPAEAADGS